MSLSDLIGTSIGFLLTIAVFSYLLGDNQFFRLAIYLFIGVSAGYVAALILYTVIVPKVLPIFFDISFAARILLFLPVILGGLLFFKLSPRISWLGTLSMAILVGIGAAVIVGGAVLGTIFPQIGYTISSFNLGNGLIVFVGAVSTLIYFQFGVRKNGLETTQAQKVVAGIGVVGQFFIAIAFGVIFAGVYAAALTAFLERTQSLVNFILQIFQSL